MTGSESGGDDLRVSDAEREQTVVALREHVAAGRLSFEEFNDRVGDAYGARTASDLQRVLADLPSPSPAAHEAPRRRWWSRRATGAVRRFVMVNGICVGIWAAGSTAGGMHAFWPIWVLIPSGALLVRRVCAPGGPEGVAHRRHEHRHEQRRHYHGDAGAPDQRSPADTAPDRVVMSVVFADIVSSTAHAVALGDAGWRRMLDSYESAVVNEVRQRSGEMLFTKGDEFVAGFASAAAAVEVAFAMRQCANALGLQVRAGVHAGEVDRRGTQANGIAMHIGRRVCEAAAPDQVLVSSTVRDLLNGAGITFTPAGEHELKGLGGTWQLYEPLRKPVSSR